MINKKVVMIVGIILLAAGVTYAAGVKFFAGDSHSDITDGLVLNLDLTQDNYVAGTKTFADDSNAKRDAVSTNAATFTTDKYGKSTGAMNFNGVNDNVTATGFSELGTSNRPYSFAGWFKTSTGETDGNIIFMSVPSGWCLPPVAIDGGYLRGHSWNNGPVSVYSTTPIVANTWYHFVNTWNSSGGLKIYVNGILEATTPQADYTASGASNYINIGYTSGIGCSEDKGWFNGSVSQIRIWNRELSAAEVRALYNSSKPKMNTGSIESGLVGHWALNSEGYNSVTGRVTDKTPYENHGTNSGATLTTDRMGQSNNAMNFDGVDDYVNVIPSTSYEVQNLSIGFWVNPSVQDFAIITLLDKDHSTIPNNQGWVIQSEDATTNRHYYFGYYNGSNWKF
jgi:hypothetical protein